MNWRPIVLWDFLYSLMAGALFWAFVLMEGASITAEIMDASPRAILADLVSIRLR